MKSFARLAAVAFAATVLALPAAAHAGAVTPRHINEMFRGTSIDPDVWSWWGTNQPDAATFAQSDGAMTVTVSGAAQPDVNVSGGTRCLARGDFDARVHFSLDAWPPENGIWVSLMLSGTPFNVYRVSWQFPDHEQYGAYLPPANGIAVATGTTGELRLTREGATITAWYISDHHWVPILSSDGPSDDAAFTLGVFNISGAATLSGQPVTVSFDDFRVAADSIVCP